MYPPSPLAPCVKLHSNILFFANCEVRLHVKKSRSSIQLCTVVSLMGEARALAKRRPRTTGGASTGRGVNASAPRTRGCPPGTRGGPCDGGIRVKKSDVRYGNKEGGGTHFGSEERFAWQRAQYASDAMYTMPAVKAPPFSFGTSTREDWKKIMENTKDLHNPNGEGRLWGHLCFFTFLFMRHGATKSGRNLTQARARSSIRPHLLWTASLAVHKPFTLK